MGSYGPRVSESQREEAIRRGRERRLAGDTPLHPVDRGEHAGITVLEHATIEIFAALMAADHGAGFETQNWTDLKVLRAQAIEQAKQLIKEMRS